MSRKKSKAAKKNKPPIEMVAKNARADFTKHLDQGFEDTFYDQKGTIEDVARMVAADGADESGLLRSSSPAVVEQQLPMRVVTLTVAVLLSVFILSLVMHPQHAAASALASLV